jgi:hypothetical protein
MDHDTIDVFISWLSLSLSLRCEKYPNLVAWLTLHLPRIPPWRLAYAIIDSCSYHLDEYPDLQQKCDIAMLILSDDKRLLVASDG